MVNLAKLDYVALEALELPFEDTYIHRLIAMVAVIVGLVAIHVLVPIRCWRNVPNKLRRHEQDSQQWPKRFLPSRAHTRGGKAAVSLHAVVGQQAVMKEDETLDPMATGLLGPAAVMSRA